MNSSLTSKIRIGAGLVTWSSFRDRVTTYRQATEIFEALRQAAKIPGVRGVDVSRNYMPENIKEFKAVLQDLNLEVASVGAGLSSGPNMVHGSFSANNVEIRKIAIDRVKESMDIAKELGSDKVLLWFGQDGYDYHFETDYKARWNYLVEGIRDCAQYRDDVRLCVEYKAREPKIHQFVNSASTALVLIQDVNEKNVGVLFDVGHALLADETLAESAVMLAQHNKLWHIHLNDNYKHADSDLVPGTVHSMAFLELFFWLKRLDYEGYVTFDTVAHSHDPYEVTAESVQFTKLLIASADRINNTEMDLVFSTDNAMKGLSIARAALFNH
ncbi:MAG: sugar phosphate isomerase/epimerase family protein [Anaerolineaceae bacterium]